MTAPTLTKQQEARRELPGGGKLFPVRHIVRIVVVQFDTDDHSLKAAEEKLKQMKPPSSAGMPGPARAADANGKKPKSMFEALSPTDIVVVGRDPASVVNKNRKRQLAAHDHHETATVLRVWTEADTIEYQCDEPFEIVRVKRAGWKIHGAPENLFGIGEANYKAQERNLPGGRKQYVWTSGFVPASANNQQYKASFKIGGKLIDPDVVCGSPPPGP